MDTRDNPVVVSGKGSIKFVVQKEKGPDKMLRKWKRRVNGWKVRKEKTMCATKNGVSTFSIGSEEEPIQGHGPYLKTITHQKIQLRGWM